MKKRLLLMLALIVSATSFSQDVTSVAIIGAATTSGWGGTPIAFVGPDANGDFTLSLNLTQNNCKFVITDGTNDGWCGYDNSLTGGGFPTGTAKRDNLSGQSDVPIGSTGYYDVKFNKTSRVYTFTLGVSPNDEIKFATATNMSGTLMNTTDGINYELKSVTFPSGGETASFKRTSPATTWVLPTALTGTATVGATPAIVPQGTYNVSFNKNTGLYSLSFAIVSTIGSGSPSGSWDNTTGDTAMTTTDGVIYRLINTTIAASGGLKFRDNQNWTNYQFGSNIFPTGTAIPANNVANTDIPTVAGSYDIEFNRSTLVYKFVAPNTLGTKSFVSKTFSAYPNPAQDNWSFSSDKSDITAVKIIDATGKTVYSSNKASNNLSVDASGLAKGIYFAKVTSGSTTETIKLLKK
jgi:starch-binding outer membrane protein SusE/F